MRRRSLNPHARRVDPSSLISLADMYAEHGARITAGRDRLVTLAQQGRFPRPLDPQARRLHFRRDEIEAWIARGRTARATNDRQKRRGG